MADDAPSLDLGDGVILETPVPDPNKIFNANDLMKNKRKGPRPKSQIAPKRDLDKPLKGETYEQSLIRRLLECAKAHTQLASIIPDQCTGCVDRHRRGVRNMPECHCACHEARAYLTKQVKAAS